MLIFTAQSLAFVAVPKTGTTALEQALKPHADLSFGKSLKHTTAQRFHRKIRPFLQDTFGGSFEAFAVLRQPEDQIRSWYKYRSRDEIADKPEYAGHMSFDQFVREVISDHPAPCAGIGSQWGMLTGWRGRLLVDHLFAYEQWSRLEEFLSDRLATRIVCETRNVSPHVAAELEPKTRALLQQKRSDEFALHARLMDAGGKLSPKRRTAAI